jgi:hypothetical protein
MSFIDRCLTRGFPFATVILLGICTVASRKALADTNLVNKESWVVDGTDDAGPNPTNIAMSIHGHAAGSFSKLAVSYDVGGTGVVTVCTITGAGEIRLALPPPGEFGGSFFTTGYWDCDEGFIPTLLLTELDIRVKGGKNGSVEFKGKASNGTSMNAKDFSLKFYTPQPDLVRADLRYSLVATRDFCVDQTIHTNADNFPVVRMAANFLSITNQDNDQVRYLKVIGQTCVLGHCVTDKESFCNDLVNQDGFIIDGGTRIGDPTLYLVHTQALPRNTPTLEARLLVPRHARIRAQGAVTASADPTAQNVGFWGNWMDPEAQYRARRKVGKFRYRLQVVPPRVFSCGQEQ